MRKQIALALLLFTVILLFMACSPSDFPPAPHALAPFEAVRNFISGAVVFVPNFANPAVTEQYFSIDPLAFGSSGRNQKLTATVRGVDIVYRFGHVWYGDTWHEFEFTGKPVLPGSNWLYKEAVADIDVTPEFDEGQHGVAAYGCSKTADGWDCHGNQWMAQIFTVGAPSTPLPGDAEQETELPVSDTIAAQIDAERTTPVQTIDDGGQTIDDGGLCSANFDPVCGSDGKTYPNECKAVAAGVTVAAKGECAARCGNNICEQGEADNPGVCNKRADGSDVCSGGLPGTCPRDCVQLLPKPVERYMGLGAPQPGNCLVRASVSSNLDIRCSRFPPPGFEFNSVTKQCAQVSAGCGGSVPFSSKGQCISSCINQCPSKAGYVCGVDAKTYHNDCVARSAGVSVLHTGQCVEKDRCALTASSSGSCTRIETVFEFVGNACVSKELKGCAIISPFTTKGQCDRVCVGATCPTNFDPVCAYGGPTNSNQKTYDNECLALSNGLTILNKGKCTQDVLAECNTQPEDTVCSATGKEYRNNCAVTLAQVNVLQRGGCSPRQRERALNPLLDPPQNQKQVVDVELFSDDTPVTDTYSGLRLVRARLVDGSGHVMVVQDPDHINRNNLIFRIVNTEQTGGIVKTDYIQHTIDASTTIIPVTARIVGKTTLAEEAQGVGVPIKIDDGGLCATNFDPVCGSDGKTYPNECKAVAAGVTVAAKGKCGAVPGQCADSDAADYFTKGSVTIEQKVYDDACIVFGLNEYVCKGNAVDSQVVLCRCKDGACLP